MFEKNSKSMGSTLGTVALLFVILLSGCAGGGSVAPASNPPAAQNNPTPSVASVTPANAAAGGIDFQITVSGTSFVSGANVVWSGSNLATVFVSATQLTATVPASRIATPGSAQIQVANPAPGGGLSNSLAFAIDNGVPLLNSISPASTPAGSESFTITVDGANFVAGSVIQWNGNALPTAVINGSQLTAQVSASRIAAAGASLITVYTPAPGGGVSSAMNFTTDPTTARFAYSAQPYEGFIARYMVDDTTSELRYSGYQVVAAAGDGPWDLTVSRTGRFMFGSNWNTNTVSAFEVDSTTGALTPFAGSPYAAGTNPYFIAIHPSGRFLYVTNYGSGDVSAYQIDAQSMSLTPIGGAAVATGSEPGRPVVDLDGRFLFVPNYTSDTISAFAIDSTTGALTSVPGSPFAATGSGPWIGSVDPSGRFLLVAYSNSGDGSTYSIDPSTGALTPVSGSLVALGSYPQGVTFDSAGRFVYIPSYDGNVYAFSFNSGTGGLTTMAGSPFAAGSTPAGIAIDNSLRRAYVPNSSSWDMTMFEVDPATGVLTSLGNRALRQNPYAVALVEGAGAVTVQPEFAYMPDATSTNIRAFAVNTTTGSLTGAGSFAAAMGANSIALNPTENLLYSLGYSTNSLSAMSVNPATGGLGSQGGSVATGQGPMTVAVDPSNRFAYVTNSNSNTVTAYQLDAAGNASAIGSVATQISPAAVAVDPTGRYVYVTNSGSTSISIYRADGATGALSLVANRSSSEASPSQIAIDPLSRFACVSTQSSVRCFRIYAAQGDLIGLGALASGMTPGGIAITPDGNYVFVTDRNLNTVTGFRFNSTAGTFSQVGISAAGTTPVSVSVDPSGRFAYVVNSGSSDVTLYSIDLATGALNIVTTMTGMGGNSAGAIAVSKQIQ